MTETGPKKEQRMVIFDNLKGILMFLVVFGHFLECCGMTGSLLYRVIYSFHMPLFIFISGYFASFSLKKLLTRLVLPYVLFQIIYLLFSGLILNPGTLSIQFIRPYWILWYLFALIIYYLLTVVLNFKRTSLMIVTVAVLFILSLAAGFSDKIGYDFSLSRIITFSPFFFSGFYLSKSKAFEASLRKRTVQKLPPILLFAAAAAASVVFLKFHPEISARVLYGANSYQATGTGPAERTAVYIIAAVFICLAVSLTFNIKIPIISKTGKNTLSVYLLHVFIQRLVLKYGLLKNVSHPVLLSLLAALIVTVMLGQIPLLQRKKKPLP